MISSIIALAVLSLLTLLVVALAWTVPQRFSHGKNWLLIPAKMAYPILAWPMTVTGAVCTAGSLSLMLAVPRGGALWYINLIITLLSLGGAAAHLSYILRVIRPHAGFAQAFGPDWAAKMPPITGMLSHRWSPFPYPGRPVRLERNVAVWTFPETERQLLADLWQPAEGTPPTGVAFLFFHGSAWHFGDKGAGTDPMCRHLAAQGHVVLDVAYRLAPEADITGMVSDVKRSVAWVKQNAARLGVNPGRVVVGGASAGGHISLLATYGNSHPAFSPADLAGTDTRVAGVISLYGPSDMRAYLDHHAGRMTMTGKRATGRKPVSFEAMSGEQMMWNLFGGLPDEVPHMYDLADPGAHVTPGAPPALIVQGEADFVVSPRATREFVAKLRHASVPVVYLELPNTEHAWDIGSGMVNLVMKKTVVPAFMDSQYAPPTTAMLYDMERFLAYLAQ